MSPQKNHQLTSYSSTQSNSSEPRGENQAKDGEMLKVEAIAVQLDQIKLPSYQPRQHFDEEAMEQLTTSVKQHGILQPLMVRPVGKGEYELVAGERRYRAAKEAALKAVPAVIKEMSAKEARELALLENLHREDLNAIEETEGIVQLLALTLECDVQKGSQILHRLKHVVDKSPSSIEDEQNIRSLEEDEAGDNGQNVLPKDVGEFKKVKSVFDSLNRMSWESFVKNRLSLLNLPAEVLEAVRKNRLKYTKAQAIARIKDDEERSRVLSQAIADGWSLKQIKEHIKERVGAKRTNEPNYLFSRLDTTYKQIKTSMAKNREQWLLPQNQERLEVLLTELEKLLSSGET